MSEKGENAKLIVSAALTGSIHVASQTPYLPITPAEIAEEAYESWQAGASFVHTHARDPQTGKPTSDLNLLHEIICQIKQKCDAIINITTGGALGMSKEERIAGISTFEPELASLNMGSMNFCIYPILEKVKAFRHLWEKEYVETSKDIVFRNTFADLEYFFTIMQRGGTNPELEIYDASQLYNAAYLLRTNVLEPPIWLQLVMGILGGIDPSLENLLFMKSTVGKLFADFSWSACASGKDETPMATAATILGGHVRVGLEDNLYIIKGVLAKSNAELVTKVMRMVNELGRSVFTSNETRKTLGLKGIDKLNF